VTSKTYTILPPPSPKLLSPYDSSTLESYPFFFSPSITLALPTPTPLEFELPFMLSISSQGQIPSGFPQSALPKSESLSMFANF